MYTSTGEMRASHLFFSSQTQWWEDEAWLRVSFPCMIKSTCPFPYSLPIGVYLATSIDSDLNSEVVASVP